MSEGKNFYILFLILAFPFLWVWQGLDFLDHGYWLTAYQQFISYPEGIGDVAISSWGTLAIGYAWQSIFGGFGLVSFKLAYAVITIFSSFIAYYSLRKIFFDSRGVLLFVCFVTLTFVSKKTGIIDYNNLTALFYLLGGGFIFSALSNQSRLIMLLSGLILGFNLFIRLPNVLGVLLVTAIWLYAYIDNWKVRKTMRFSMFFISGYFSVIVFVLFVMHKIGHLEYYLGGLKSILGLDSGVIASHHSSNLLLWLLFRDYSLALLMGAICIFVSVFFIKKIVRFSNKIRWLSLFALAFIAAPILGFKHIDGWLIPGVLYIVLLTALFFQVRSKDRLAALTYIALALLVLAPLGSNNGMWNAFFGMWLALPLALMTLYNISDVNFKGFFAKQKEVRTMYQAFVLVILFFSFMTALISTYHDNKNRFKMTDNIVHPFLENTFTTKVRASAVQSLLRELAQYVKPGDKLLAYNKIPMIYYLTGTEPWFGDSWPMAIPREKLEALIKGKVVKNTNFPIIVRALGDTSNREWPEANNFIGDNYHAPGENRKLLDEFIFNHGYNEVWENKFFQILSPPT